LLPETGLIFGRQSKRFSHYFYRSDPPVRTQQFHDPIDRATLIELRGLSSDGSIGLQTVVPPSIHETGEAVKFEQGFDGTPANVDADVLVSAVRKTAAVALLSRHWPAKGSRHHAFLALAGVLARAEWRLDDAKAFHRVIYRCLWPTNPELDAADSEVQSTFEKHSSGGEDKLPRVEEVIPCATCTCASCGEQTAVIGYDESELLDVEPAHYFVRVTKREKRACRRCENATVIAAPLAACRRELLRACPGPGDQSSSHHDAALSEGLHRFGRDRRFTG
jgi:zinc-finger binding domain of transposase IS66